MRRFHPFCRTVVTLAFVAMFATSASAAPKPITSCGETYDRDVYLPQDLDCSGSPTHGIDMRRGGKLHLNGFSIRNAQIYGVQCGSVCTIEGPGGIVDGAGIAVRIGNRAILRNVTISGNGGPAIDAINNSGSTRISVTGSTIVNNRAGIYCANRIQLTDSTVTGNETYGIRIHQSDESCRRGSSLKMYNSVVSGNATSSECAGNADCADIETCTEPRLDETSTCGTSQHTDGSGSWGSCTGD